MFHTGDLQSGIALAVQQSKSVVCFVRDDSPTSQQWERDFLNDETIIDAIKDHAVALRLGSGSQEASFLTAFCPLNEVPALVLIRNGRLLDLIQPGISDIEFKSRIIHALRNVSEGSISMQDSAPLSSDAVPAPTLANTPQNTDNSSHATAEAPSNSSETTRSQSSHGRSNPASNTPSRPRNPSATPLPPPDSLANTNSDRQTWVQSQARQNQVQRTERERILKQIEDDKAERRLRAQQKRSLPTHDDENNRPQRHVKKPTETRVQVRLFDGSSVRNSFPSNSSVINELRPWLDHELTSGENVPVPPYSLKIINPPQPPRTLDITEEERPLSDLDLGSSATMVMVPLQGAVDAYDSPGGVTGVVGSAAGGVTSVVGWGSRGVYNSVNRVVGSVLWGVRRATGYGTVDENAALHDQSSTTDDESVAKPDSSNIKIRTLADQRQMSDDEKKQWYNGNQLNFEPKPDDDDTNRKDD